MSRPLAALHPREARQKRGWRGCVDTGASAWLAYTEDSWLRNRADSPGPRRIVEFLRRKWRPHSTADQGAVAFRRGRIAVPFQ